MFLAFFSVIYKTCRSTRCWGNESQFVSGSQASMRAETQVHFHSLVCMAELSDSKQSSLSSSISILPLTSYRIVAFYMHLTSPVISDNCSDSGSVCLSVCLSLPVSASLSTFCSLLHTAPRHPGQLFFQTLCLQLFKSQGEPPYSAKNYTPQPPTPPPPHTPLSPP